MVQFWQRLIAAVNAEFYRMEKNVGGLDRTARLIVGPILVIAAVAALLGYLAVGTIVAGIALLVGAILSVTGTTQKCPANKTLGINTFKR